MKKCIKCGLDKKNSEFVLNKAGKLASWCNSCKNERAREWYNKNKYDINQKQLGYRAERKQWFNDYKQTLKCERCGESHPATLDFHHLDPTKKEFNISDQLWAKNKEKVLEEISKCIVVCSNCHRKIHWKENNQ
jgi:hypothetical protein